MDRRKDTIYIVRRQGEEVMDHIARRSFLKKAACLGGGVLLSQSPLSGLAQSRLQAPPPPDMEPDLVAVKGKDPYINTLRAIQELGGIEAFVRRGDRVGVLVNSPFKNIGASVNPDVALAVIEKCLEGGAKEVRYLKDPHRGISGMVVQERQTRHCAEGPEIGEWGPCESGNPRRVKLEGCSSNEGSLGLRRLHQHFNHQTSIRLVDCQNGAVSAINGEVVDLECFGYQRYLASAFCFAIILSLEFFSTIFPTQFFLGKKAAL